MEEQQQQHQCQQQVVDGGIVDRLFSLPLVEKTFNFVNDKYTVYGKKSELPLVKDSISFLENTVSSAYEERAKPLLERHADTLKSLDSFACEKWDLIGEKVVKARATVDGTCESISRELDERAHKAEKVVLYPSSKLLEVAEHIVDSLLPSVANEEHDESFYNDNVNSDSDSDSEDNEEEQEEQAGDEKVVNLEDRSNGKGLLLSEGLGTHPLYHRKLGSETTRLYNRTRRFTSELKTRSYERVLSEVDNIATKATQLAADAVPITKKYAEKAFENLQALAEDEKEVEMDVLSDSKKAPQTLSETAIIQVTESAKWVVRPFAKKCVLAIDTATLQLERLLDILEQLEEFGQDTFVTVYVQTTDVVKNTTTSLSNSYVFVQFHHTLTDFSNHPSVVAISKTLFEMLTAMGVKVPDVLFPFFPHLQVRRTNELPPSYPPMITLISDEEEGDGSFANEKVVNSALQQDGDEPIHVEDHGDAKEQDEQVQNDEKQGEEEQPTSAVAEHGADSNSNDITISADQDVNQEDRMDC